MWTNIKTKIANLFGFRTLDQIANQYKSPYEDYWNDYLADRDGVLTVEPGMMQAQINAYFERGTVAN